ncbi:MAG: single-stranded DNA-binding protein [Oscillospiraceae bacterium]|nr:single-stranded DNA-binding protein [Oscillospiraceae bacterium]
MENNNISIMGYVEDSPVFSHRVMDEDFYKFNVRVPRLSETEDVLPVTISEKLICPWLQDGVKVRVTGQLRSYNKYTDTGTHLVLTVFVKEIDLAELGTGENPNEIFINGFICKPPVYRKTPFGREITDLIVAVNRAFNRSDYIPAIAWGRNAVFAEKLEVGTNVQIWGRLQSREYVKRLSETESETRTAYELSITKIEKFA